SPQDNDQAPDIYDARIGEGFPEPQLPAASCEGEACYGPLTNPAPLLVPGSAVQAPGGNLAQAPRHVASRVKAKKPVKHRKSKRRKRKHTRAGKSAVRKGRTR